jgi:hypothetical protein
VNFIVALAGLLFLGSRLFPWATAIFFVVIGAVTTETAILVGKVWIRGFS